MVMKTHHISKTFSEFFLVVMYLMLSIYGMYLMLMYLV